MQRKRRKHTTAEKPGWTTCRVCSRDLPPEVFRSPILGGKIQSPACRPCTKEMLVPRCSANEQNELAKSFVTALSSSARSTLQKFLKSGDLLVGEWDFSHDYAVLNGRPTMTALLQGWSPASGSTIAKKDAPYKWTTHSGIMLEPSQLAYYESELSNNALRAALKLPKKRRRTAHKAEEDPFADL